MTNRIPGAIGFILCLALALSLLPLTGSPVSSREKWEYKVAEIRRDAERSERALNALGASGWELVTVHDSNSTGALYTFKRRLPEQ